MNRMLIIMIILFVWALPAAADFEGKVHTVANGNTVHVSRYGQPIKVTIRSIRPPNWDSKYADKARKGLEDLVKGEKVIVKTKDPGLIGGVYGDVVLKKGGANVAQELVRQGFARWDRNADPNNSTLARLESEAQEKGEGLWKDKKARPVSEDASGFARNDQKNRGALQVIKKDEKGRCIVPGSPDYKDLEDFTPYTNVRECRRAGGTITLPRIPLGKIKVVD